MRRRRLGLILICSAVLPLAVAATAWACGTLATLKLSSGVAAPGATLTANGANFSNAAGASPVTIRLNSRTGPVLGSVPATSVSPSGAGGRISTSIQLPANTPPGFKVVMATQTTLSNGVPVPKSGTPARTTLRVQGAAAGSSAPASPWASSKPTGGPGGSGATVTIDGGGSGAPALPTLLGVVLSLTLLGSGLTLVGRGRNRPAGQPALGV